MGTVMFLQKKSLVQLPLSLKLKDEATFENFYPGKNSEIISQLKKTASGKGEKIIYLCSARGDGASHLLQACCHYAYQHHIRSVYLPLKDLIHLSADVLIGLESLDLVCIDDLEIIAGNLSWEENLFHLFNRVYDAGGRFVFAARHLPKFLPIHLEDLISRLSWGIIYQLIPLVDEEKLNVLKCQADQRGMHLSDEAAKYLLTHCERQMSLLFGILNELDKASLSAQRRLTIPFIKEVLRI
jgi:DnaA-homolog protein